MATKKRTKKYDLIVLVDCLRMSSWTIMIRIGRATLLIEFENDLDTIAHLQLAATANSSHYSVQSAGNTSDI